MDWQFLRDAGLCREHDKVKNGGPVGGWTHSPRCVLIALTLYLLTIATKISWPPRWAEDLTEHSGNRQRIAPIMHPANRVAVNMQWTIGSLFDRSRLNLLPIIAGGYDHR